MELNVAYLPYDVNQWRMTKIIADIVHSPEFTIRSREENAVERPINFEVKLHESKAGGVGNDGTGILTFSTEEIGNKFLKWVKDTPLRIDKKRVRFYSRGKASESMASRLAKTPYIDPDVEENHDEILWKLKDPFRVDSVQFGVLFRPKYPLNPKEPLSPRAFSVEWERHYIHESAAWLSFEYDHKLIRITLGSQATEKQSASIAIKLTSIEKIAAGYDPKPYFCFDTLTPPVLEETEFHRTLTGDKKLDNAKFKRRVGSLHPGHRVVSPYAQHLRIVLCSDPVVDVVTKFFGMCEIAGLPKSKLFRCDGRNVIEADNRGFFTPKRLYQLEREFKKLPWPIAFQLESLLHNCTLHTDDIFDILPKVNALLKNLKEDYVANLLRSYHEKLQIRPARESPLRCFERVHRDFNFANLKLSSGNFMCCHVTYTPTRIILEGPYATQSNRVIRWYRDYLHHFIRVDFRDEDRLQYRWERAVDATPYLQERVGGILKNGFELAGRSFEFLAYSTSALREHAVWFMQPFKHKEKGWINSEYIRESLGNFKGTPLLKCPSKYAARLSQAFTATDDSVTVHRHEWQEIPDMGTEPHLFTDGVGTISQSLGDRIWEKLCSERSDHGKKSIQPSAYQIRFLGYKGMVSVDKELDKRSDGIIMQLRPSMNKFTARQAETAVIEIARAFDYPNTCYLSRPLIMLLEDLGAHVDTFLKLQEDAVRDARTIDESTLRFRAVLDGHGLGRSYHLSPLLKRLGDLGLELHPHNQTPGFDNPFLRQVRQASMLDVLREIKHNARIPVPESYLLVGVADEGPAYKASGMENVYTLPEGHIYACIQESPDSEPMWLEGSCSISRSPIAHIGDVQRARAIGKPPQGKRCLFGHMKNVVVLPSVGRRSLASMLGGGDLDGDQFSVICYQDLLPQERERAAEYPAVQAFTIERDSNIEDICNFVVEYIHSDVLGLLSNRLLVIADQSILGMRDEDCQTLAELCSKAVDYPKHGMPVNIDDDTLPRALIRRKPDWHGAEVSVPHDTNDYYESSRALGVLFRQITLKNPEPIQNGSGGVHPLKDPISLALEPRIRRYLTRDSWLGDISSATIDIFQRYRDELQYICATHVLSNAPGVRLLEAEVVAGTILAKCTQKRWRSDRIYRMRLHASTLVRQVQRDLIDDINDASTERLVGGIESAWEAWKYSQLQGSETGAGSFGLIALNVIFDCFERLGGLEVPDLEIVERSNKEEINDAIDSYWE